MSIGWRKGLLMHDQIIYLILFTMRLQLTTTISFLFFSLTVLKSLFCVLTDCAMCMDAFPVCSVQGMKLLVSYSIWFSEFISVYKAIELFEVLFEFSPFHPRHHHFLLSTCCITGCCIPFGCNFEEKAPWQDLPGLWQSPSIQVFWPGYSFSLVNLNFQFVDKIKVSQPSLYMNKHIVNV